jgi:hypothetical protein
MQIARVEHRSVKILLLALTGFSAADAAKSPINLIEKASHLLQSVIIAQQIPEIKPEVAFEALLKTIKTKNLPK